MRSDIVPGAIFPNYELHPAMARMGHGVWAQGERRESRFFVALLLRMTSPRSGEAYGFAQEMLSLGHGKSQAHARQGHGVGESSPTFRNARNVDWIRAKARSTR
jgi:hypothetical protein